MIQKNINKNLLDDLTFFVKNTLKIKENDPSATLKPRKGKFNNLEYEASFGKGNFAKIPWFAFYGYEQKVQKGIYPVILFNRETYTNNFEICYGVSKNYSPNISWQRNKIQYLENSKTKAYSNSFIKKAYSINSIEDFNSNITSIFEVLDTIIDDFHSTFQTIHKQNLAAHENSIIIRHKNNTENQKTLLEIETEEQIEPFDTYTEEDFFNEVFLDKNQYSTLKNLLLNKMNIILEGAPGVGKTYAATRLAYSILGKKDKNKVKMIQFHQSYGYEDFIMGYRPNENGFELVYGSFYKFCKMAEEDSDNKYFFIIDEINRGKLSKIFGELLMLIEPDKRGQTLRLLYKDEEFSVPKNLYIIGMMNTADRSIAMIDYALRRRFAFYTFSPAFETESFKNYLKKTNNSKYKALLDKIILLNNEIKNDCSLGSGFQIGHSYFLTNNEITDEWMRFVIEYEIIPLLKEYWFDEQAKVDTWTNKLRSVLN